VLETHRKNACRGEQGQIVDEEHQILVLRISCTHLLLDKAYDLFEKVLLVLNDVPTVVHGLGKGSVLLLVLLGPIGGVDKESVLRCERLAG